MKKFSLLTLIFTLLLSVSIPNHLFAESLDNEVLEEQVILYSDDDIILYEDEAGTEQILTVPNNSTVILLNIVNEDYSYIRYVNPDDEEEIEGYVRNEFVQAEEEDSVAVEEEDQTPNEEDDLKIDEAESTEVETEIEEEVEDEGSIQLAKAATEQGERLRGVALKETHVYEKNSRDSKVLRSYATGSNLIYRTFNQDWYVATVFLNGKAHTGYIHKSDVTGVLQGYAQREQTNVYESRTKGSKVLKSYRAGDLLKYRPYNNTWFEVTIYLSGKKHTGYIHKDDVGNNLPVLEGYSQPGSTNVYEQTNKSSKVLKNYSSGRLLKYRPHNDTWFAATVLINGKAHAGYIHKNDVGDKVAQTTSYGYAQLSETGVYAKTSKGSQVLKSYNAGTKLKYRTYNDSWYEATVFVKGKAQTGFIYKKDVGSSIPSLSGIAMKGSTPVYSATSKSSTVLKSYNSGHLLKYRPYNSSWYEATVFINGVKRTGYIHHGDVVNPAGKTVMIDAGHGGHDSGASGNGLREKDLTLDLALKTQRMLENSGFTVIMTRSTDTYLTLAERSALANSSNVDIFVSLHINAGGGTGIETYWQEKHEAQKSNALAAAIQGEVINETGSVNRGVKNGNFHVIRETKMPSSLVEINFIDRKEDAEELKQDSFLNKAVKGVVNGIKKFFNM